MQLLELTLHNYKIHRKKTLIFEPGVVGIIGDNGCGKSSIFSAICFLFTGEVDVDKKADLLTLGEAEGWVKGKFTHNNKEGTIERHISSPKIVLTYDGITYNKVTEVNLLWSEMLQIDAAVFNNVIVAKQGEIQNLFSDESVIREKIFQKIFMVPPTEKIRSCIWDNYIKACPPEKLEEDIQLLQANQVAIAGKRNEILSEIDRKQINSLTSIVLHSINNRISFLKQCQSDLVEKPAVEFNLNSYKTELGANEAAVDELKVLESRLLAKGDLQLELNDLIVIKTKFEQKQSLAQEILNLSKQADRDSLTRLQLNLKALNEQTEEKRNELNNTNTKLKEVTIQMDKFKNLAGKVCCPTCDQELQDMTGFIDNLNTQIIDLKSRQIKINNLYSQALHKSKLAQEEAGKMEIIVRRIAYLTEEWNKLSEVEFSKDKYDSISKSILDLKIIQASIQSVNQRISELTTEIRVLNEKLSNLSIYDGNVTIEEELTVLDSAIKGDERIKEEINEFKLEAGKLEHELLLLEQRIKTSEDNSVYNLRRKEYLSSLTAAYDIFHASQFPRKLIESYMDHVQVYLANYLEYFNLPYSVRVEDGFKIRLYEPEGVDPLPRVSGGQEMMVGICLRLALHKMFAKAFSLWLIDEGTTHLSESKKQNYFDLIDELRNQKVIKQIIIIDHDERLANVVDQIIEL